MFSNPLNPAAYLSSGHQCEVIWSTPSVFPAMRGKQLWVELVILLTLVMVVLLVLGGKHEAFEPGSLGLSLLEGIANILLLHVLHHLLRDGNLGKLAIISQVGSVLYVVNKNNIKLLSH